MAGLVGRSREANDEEQETGARFSGPEVQRDVWAGTVCLYSTFIDTGETPVIPIQSYGYSLIVLYEFTPPLIQ